jgi:hypothetical protein
VEITPITRPRISRGKRSVVMANTTEPITPPNNPVTMRAIKRSGKVVAKPHSKVPSMNPK